MEECAQNEAGGVSTRCETVDVAQNSSARPSCGVLVIDKPPLLSSAQVVARVRKLFPKSIKVGHAGTLDPNATGLLVLLVGKATRLASHAESGTKEYKIALRLGQTTTTDDVWGETLTYSEALPIEPTIILRALKSFEGVISQTPPQVSAIKVNGERAYNRVREGETVVLQPRTVTVHAIEDVSIQWPEVRMTLRCSKGTYMRSIARDLGQQLGCGGCISEIRRSASWPFSLDQAVKLEDLKVANVLSWDTLFPSTPRFSVDDATAEALGRGDLRGLAFDRLDHCSDAGCGASGAKNEGEGGLPSNVLVCVRASDNHPCALLKKESLDHITATETSPQNTSNFRWILAANMSVGE